MRVIAEHLLPRPVFVKLRQRRLNRTTRALDRRSTFSRIYAANAWGGELGTFFSGQGSLEKYLPVYQHILSDVLKSMDNPTIVDLGCGDFRVGSAIRPPYASYIGVDVVPELIERNSRMYTRHLIHFQCLDITRD